MTETGQSRIRWNEDELEAVAQAMFTAMQADPALGLLDAVKLAQTVLPSERQRDIKTWAAMAARLQPKLDALVERIVDEAPGAATAEIAQVLPPTAEVLGEMAGGAILEDTRAASTVQAASELDSIERAVGVSEGEPTAEVALQKPGAPTPHVPALAQSTVGTPPPAPVNPDTLMVEAGLVAALQSPAVQAALVGAFSQAMAKAFAQLSERSNPASEPAVAEVVRTHDVRVLLAGFAAPVAKSLEEGLRNICEVRTWKPVQGPQLFETLARICNVAVIPEDMDSEVDSDLRARDLVVLRHTGSATKLRERLESVFA